MHEGRKIENEMARGEIILLIVWRARLTTIRNLVERRTVVSLPHSCFPQRNQTSWHSRLNMQSLCPML